MRVRVQKWGNSLALRIPKSLAAESNIEQGSCVELSLENGRLIVSPMADTEFTLDELLAHITKENIHTEIETGHAIGKEAW